MWLLALVLSVTTMSAQQYTLRGTVQDKDGEPLIGASVIVQHSKTGVSTDMDGRFAVKAKKGETLTVSYIGYTTQTIRIAGQNDITVTLSEDTGLLEEVVVVGYGTVRKKDLTGAVTQINPDKLADQNPNTVQDVLRGTAGLQVGMDTSAQGGGTLQLRGQNSVYTSGDHNSPLIILDGMDFYGTLSEINPDDIAQIDVLKDASAAAVYGARAASGVIIITTKKGKAGKPVITASANIGMSRRTNFRKVYSADEVMSFREAYYKDIKSYGRNPETGKYEYYQAVDKNGNLAYQPGYFDHYNNLSQYGITQEQWLGYTTNTDMSLDEVYARRLGLHESEEVLSNYLLGRTYNWADDAFRTGFNQDYNASMSGATERINYYMSFGFLKNEGAVKGDDYRSVRANIKLNGKVTKWLEVGSNINFQDRSDDSQPADWGSSLRNSPYASKYNEDGSLAQYPMSVQSKRGYNYDFEKQYYDLEKGWMILNTIFNAKVTLPLGITYQFNIAPRYQYYYNRKFTSSEKPDASKTETGVNRDWGKRFDWSLNNIITWDYTIAKDHHFILTLVQEAEERRMWSDDKQAYNILPSDALGFHNTSNATMANSKFSTTDTHSTADALMARLFYAYDNRYLLTATLRRDGYSAFGQNYPHATFPSVALGWNFTQEKFWNWQGMTSGKLRVSWGKNGNRSLADEYMALANLGSGVGATMGYLGANGQVLTDMKYLSYDRLANPYLQWEKTESLNVGLDFGFLNDRITGSIDWYDKKTHDMIMYKALPDFSGFSQIATNLGEVSNKGVEVALNTVNIRNKSLVWTTTATFAYNRNRINHLYYENEDILDANGNVIGQKEMDDTSNNWFIGKPIGEIWNYKFEGIWQEEEYEEAARSGQRPGDPKIANIYTADDIVNADGTITPVYNDKDKVFLGTTTPPVIWTLRNQFVLWDKLDIACSIYSYMGHKRTSTDYLNRVNFNNLMTYAFNHYRHEYWTSENRSNEYARWEAMGPKGCESPVKVHNANFIRLDNISLGYTLPTKWTRKWQIEKVRLSASVRNVAVWAQDWEYGDPETGNIAKRDYNFGVQVTF